MDTTNANTRCGKVVGADVHTPPSASRHLLYLRGGVILAIVLIALASCNVTRTVTTSAQTVQRGDTTTIIQTRTIEQYDGKVDATKLLQR